MTVPAALGAFTTKEQQSAYQSAAGLRSNQVRLDFHNGPFNEAIKVIYAGHRRWNMNRFQLAGYFETEGESWTAVTQEGYVSVLQINTDFNSQKALEKEALERYSKLQTNLTPPPPGPGVWECAHRVCPSFPTSPT